MLVLKPKRCLVVDSFPIIREALSKQLLSLECVSDVRNSCSIKCALSRLKKEHFDLLTIDVEIGQDNGFELLKRAKAMGYQERVLFISNYDYSVHSTLAKKNGANGYVSKKETTVIIRDAMLQVLRGYNIFKTETSTIDIDFSNLSIRELTVFQYLVKGHSNKEIADFLFLSEKTISTYKSRVLNKFSASNVVELIEINKLFS